MAKKFFTHTGTVEMFYRETGVGTGSTRRVNLRETKLFWFDEGGNRYSKDGGWPVKANHWRLQLDTVEKRGRDAG